MSWASERLIELEQERRRAQDALPGNVDEALRVIGTVLEELANLKLHVALQSSTRERYKDYVIGGIIGELSAPFWPP